jgi:hypothetical protein
MDGCLFQYVDIADERGLWVGILIDGKRSRRLGPFATEQARDIFCDDLAAKLRQTGATEVPKDDPRAQIDRSLIEGE